MEYNELMNGFAEKFAISGMEIEDNAVVLEIDGMNVSFIHEPATNEVILVAEIGRPPPDPDGIMGATMLKANYFLKGTGGAVLCQMPDTGAYAISRRCPLVAHDVNTFSSALEAFVNSADDWRNVISCLRVAEESARLTQDADQTEESLPGMGYGGFMQV